MNLKCIMVVLLLLLQNLVEKHFLRLLCALLLFLYSWYEHLFFRLYDFDFFLKYFVCSSYFIFSRVLKRIAKFFKRETCRTNAKELDMKKIDLKQQTTVLGEVEISRKKTFLGRYLDNRAYFSQGSKKLTIRNARKYIKTVIILNLLILTMNLDLNKFSLFQSFCDNLYNKDNVSVRSSDNFGVSKNNEVISKSASLERNGSFGEMLSGLNFFGNFDWFVDEGSNKNEVKMSKKRKKATVSNCVILYASAQLKVLSPKILRDYFRNLNKGVNSIIPASTATFGAPYFGEVVFGIMIYVESPSKFCEKDFSFSASEIPESVDYARQVTTSSTLLVARNNSGTAALTISPSNSNFSVSKNESATVVLDESHPKDDSSSANVANGTINAAVPAASQISNVTTTDSFLPTFPQKAPTLEDSEIIGVKNETDRVAPGDASLNNTQKKIFIIRRGGCSFVQKVKIAEEAGANVVVIVDDEKSFLKREYMQTVIMADSGNGHEVYIPSMLISFSDGDSLIRFIQQNSNKHDVNDRSHVFVEIQWNLPQKAIVDVDFWTDSGSLQGNKFLREFAPIAEALKDYIRFTLHYFIFSLPEDFDGLCFGSENQFCASSPTNQFSSKKTISGREVVEEDLRQLCIYKTTSKSKDVEEENTWQSEQFWAYIKKWSTECEIPSGQSSSTNTSANENERSLHTFGKACSERIMKEVLGANVDAVHTCMESSEGIQLLQEEKENRAWALFSMLINNMRFCGRLDVYQVLKAICASFLDEPPMCKPLLNQLKENYKQSDSSKWLNSQTERRNTFGFLSNTFSVLLLFFFVILLTSMFILLYQWRFKKLIRAELQNEIMLEVRSQIQEYHEMPNDDYTRSENRLLMAF